MKKSNSVFSIEYGLTLPNGESVRVISHPNHQFRCLYTFFNSNKQAIWEVEGNHPSNIDGRSAVGKKILSSIQSKSENSRRNTFYELSEALAQYVEWYNATITEIEEEQRIQEEQQHRQDIRKAMKEYSELESPIIWLGSMIDWITAGERANILISFFALSSQVVLRHPISLIGLGEGSSGKNHVCESALSLLPSQYILYEKKPTLASMFRRSEEDPYYYDGKIVVYGDMGGDSDQEEVEDTKNILKELQTDGELRKPVTIKTKDGFEVVDLILKGNPCLLYQTVPNYRFDDQELSRSILMTPRIDNKLEFNLMSQYLELVNGITYRKHEETKEKLTTMIPLVVEGLRERFMNIQIVNPYIELIEQFVGNNPHYKRDLPKYNSILKVITAFNSEGRSIHNINGSQVMFTTHEDVALFLTLFEGYRESIASSLSLVAVEILNTLKEHQGDWFYGIDDEQSFFDGGITVAKYIEKAHPVVSLRTVQTSFRELKDHSYLTVVGKQGNAPIYGIVDKENIASVIDSKELSDDAKRIILDEYGDKMLQVILSDDSDDSVCVFSQHSSIETPAWKVK